MIIKIAGKEVRVGGVYLFMIEKFTPEKGPREVLARIQMAASHYSFPNMGEKAAVLLDYSEPTDAKQIWVPIFDITEVKELPEGALIK